MSSETSDRSDRGESSTNRLSRSTHGALMNIPNLQITLSRLNGTNYLEWSQSARMFIGGKGLWGYLSGKIPQPATTSPDYDEWESNSLMIMSWLTLSMEPDVRKGYMLLKTTKADSAAQTYSQAKNYARVYQLRQDIAHHRQGETTLATYFSGLRSMWEELDFYRVFEPECEKDSVAYKREIETIRIFEFLAGLHHDFELIKVQILSRDELPSLNQVYALVQSEESRRGAMPQNTPIEVISERSALASSIFPSRGGRGGRGGLRRPGGRHGPDEKENLKCTYCGKTRHTRETCWELTGRPTHFGQPRSATAHATTSSLIDASSVPEIHRATTVAPQEALSLSKEDLEYIRLLRLQSEGHASTAFAHSGINAFANHVSIGSPDHPPWIIDSGASDHMTGPGLREDDWEWS